MAQQFSLHYRFYDADYLEKLKKSMNDIVELPFVENTDLPQPTPPTSAFGIKMAELSAYKTQHGHCNVPPSGSNLGQ